MSLLEENLNKRPIPTKYVHVAIRLLSYQFVEQRIREYAVICLEKITDQEFVQYLHQLIQAMKFEPYLDCALLRLLLHRSLRNSTLSQKLFWNLRTEIDSQGQPWYRERYIFILELFLRLTPNTLIGYVRQVELNRELQQISTIIMENRLTGKNILAFQLLLNRGRFPDTFEIPLYPNTTFDAVLPDLSKVFDSKKKPILLTLKTKETNEFCRVLFKAGDDLRQDILTLNLIDIMKRLIHEEGLLLPMITYDCTSTGMEANGQGFIQVVSDAVTLSAIQMESGGSSAVFNPDTLRLWLEKQNPEPQDMAKAISNFTASCAGFCVATYILGIGDRHNDNIMLHRDGRLFHIDYGHFLGNTKRKFGIKRERTPFILTSDFVSVMEGGDEGYNFATFLDYSLKAFLIVRKNFSLLFYLLSLMLEANLPELKNETDLEYLKGALFIDRTESEATDAFRELIAECLRSQWSTHVNWYLHNLKHR